MKYFDQLKKAKAAMVVGLMLVGATAHAALPAAATAALGDVDTGIDDAVAAAWPLIGAALVAGIIIKLVKRYSNKI